MTGALWSALQGAGFACLTVAAALEFRALRLQPSPGLRGPALHWTRAGFLGLSAALAAGGAWSWQLRGEFWPLLPGQLWGLLGWLGCFSVLHVHRVKAFQGRPELIAGMAGWLLMATTVWMLR